MKVLLLLGARGPRPSAPAAALGRGAGAELTQHRRDGGAEA